MLSINQTLQHGHLKEEGGCLSQSRLADPPFTPMFCVGCLGAWGFGQIFASSVNRTGTTKNYETELLKSERMVTGNRELLPRGNVQTKARPASVD